MLRLFKRLTMLIMAAALLCAAPMPASAEDLFTLDVDTLDMTSLNSNDYVQRYLSAQAQGIRVTKYISDSSELAARSRLTLTRMDNQTLIFDKDYGYISGVFDSGAIYLPYVDSYTVPYLVMLYIGDTVYAMPFMHMRARLRSNGASTVGVRLGDLDPALGSDWLMGTMVDLNELRSSGMMNIDICASGYYIVGSASLYMHGDSLMLQLGFNDAANAELERCSLYVITDCSQIGVSGMGLHGLPSYSLGDAVNVSGASSALIYLPMQLSYDPDDSLSVFVYDSWSQGAQRQRALFDENIAASAVWSGDGQGFADAPFEPLQEPFEGGGEGLYYSDDYTEQSAEWYAAEEIAEQTVSESANEANAPVEPDTYEEAEQTRPDEENADASTELPFEQEEYEVYHEQLPDAVIE